MTEFQLIKALQERDLSLGPLKLTARFVEATSPRDCATRPDSFVTVSWGGDDYQFVAEIKARSIPKILAEAVQQARLCAERSGLLPMIVMPYLRSEQLDGLARGGVSGIDLCGNGVVVVPGRVFVYRTGRPNQYRESLPTRYAYRGTTSIVPRVFLCQPSFDSSAQVREEIRRRGGEVALSTISKAIKRMEEDLIVTRQGRSVSLLQPDILLDKLLDSYTPPTAEPGMHLKLKVPWMELLRRQAESDLLEAPKLALSGASSADRWAVVGRSDKPVLYCESLAGLLAQWLAEAAVEDSRFPDIEVRETNEAVRFFDLRIEDGIPYAPPVQTFLELARGDKRERETAGQVKEKILRNLTEARTGASTG